MKKHRKDLTVMVTDKCVKVIDDIILQRGVSQEELSKIIGIGRTQITGMKKGERFATPEMLVGLCLNFGVNARYLLPPFERLMYLGKTNQKIIREKKILIAQTEKEIKVIEKRKLKTESLLKKYKNGRL